MDKLTAADVIGYVNHNLKGVVMYDYSKEICTLALTDGLDNQCGLNEFVNGTYQVKPILKPLSSLVIPPEWKEVITRNGYGVTTYTSLDRLVVTGNLEDAKNFLDYLYSEHYDVNNLLGRGLAVTQAQCDEIMKEDLNLEISSE